MVQYRLLGISGSLRKGATNRKLVAQAARLFDAAQYDLADLKLPLYDGDLEDSAGIPAPAQNLADQIAQADAVIISTPEYNKALSGVLKNALDWVSRTDGKPWLHKPVAIMSATAGRSGGERAQSSLRLCLNPFRPHILTGPEILIADARNAFAPDGTLKNQRSTDNLIALMDLLRQQIR
jgi:chromate reductase, NAD(P)H dehydrogenase (quinone)